MTKFGIHILPFMSAQDVIEIAVAAERIGYDYCLVADEGFMPDVYACLGVIASRTSRIVVGPATNGYTRHPAVTAAAMATLDEIADGRALVVLLAGGSMVLTPMGIERERPYRVVRDTAEVLRALWSGETIDWEGDTHCLNQARLGNGSRSIPLWITSRGPLLLGLAGRVADGVMVTVMPDLESAFGIAQAAADKAGNEALERIYLGRIGFTPELVDEQRKSIGYVLMDCPPRVMDSLGFTDSEKELIAKAAATGDPSSFDHLITDELLLAYQINGSPRQCSAGVANLVSEHQLDTVIVDVLSSDLQENLRFIEESFQILSNSL